MWIFKDLDPKNDFKCSMYLLFLLEKSASFLANAINNSTTICYQYYIINYGSMCVCVCVCMCVCLCVSVCVPHYGNNQRITVVCVTTKFLSKISFLRI